MNVYTKLVTMPLRERAEILGIGDVALCASIAAQKLERLARMPRLCPAKMSEVVYGHDMVCESLAPTPGVCRTCTERFLKSEWPNPKGPAEYFSD